MPFEIPRLRSHQKPEARGNMAALVLVDSRGAYADAGIVDQTMLIPLRHLGIPYRIHDLATTSLTPAVLEDCAVVIVAQAHVTENLSELDADLLAAAVEQGGLGLVNFDGGCLPQHPAALLRLLDVDLVSMPAVSDLIWFPGNDHFITSTQSAGSMIKLKRPVTLSLITRLGRHVRALAQATLGRDQLVLARHHIPGTAYVPGQYPAVMAANCGAGRFVQFAFSPRLWHPDFFGHGAGLDATFWRAIVWAARKPFVTSMLPPYVTLRVDDAIGYGYHDFRYADAMNAQGFIPLISCFIDETPLDLAPYMRAKWADGKVEWDAHALTYYRLIPCRFGLGELTETELDGNFAAVDRWYADRGIQPPCVTYFHWGEIGRRALPYLKARGRTFVYSQFIPGQIKWERIEPFWWPYHLPHLFYDYLPDDPDFYNVGGCLSRSEGADVLTACTVFAGENPVNDMGKAVARAVAGAQVALDSGFFFEIATHEQKLGVLGMSDIEQWLRQLRASLSRYDVRLESHERIAKHVKARDESWIDRAQFGKRNITVSLRGAAPISTEMALFTNDGDSVRQSWHTVQPFAGACELSLAV